MVENIKDYPWSSYAYHVYGKKNTILSDHERYLALDIDPVKRRKAYRSLFKSRIENDDMQKIRAA